MKKEFAIILALIVSLVILAIQYDRVENERDALQAQVKSLQTEVKRLQGSIETLCERFHGTSTESLLQAEIDTSAEFVPGTADDTATNEVDTPVFFLPEPPWQTNK